MLLDVLGLLSACSYALDCVEAELVHVSDKHAKRVAYMSVCMAEQLGISGERLQDLAACALLHDNALTQYIQEELHKDVANVPQASQVGIHCTLGEKNIQRLPFHTDVKNVILYHHENANGSGPFGKTWEEVPIFSRIIHLSDLLDRAYGAKGFTEDTFNKACGYLHKNEGTIVDKECVDAFLQAFPLPHFLTLGEDSFEKNLWEKIPRIKQELSFAQIKELASFFAQIVDYKSPFTSTHSIGVAEDAERLSRYMGFDEETVQKMYLAGALHDIGKVPDEEPELPHALLGMKLAEKYKEKSDICNAIGAHHDETEMASLLAPIVQVCDAISGARPGARREIVEAYIKRLNDLEQLALSYPGVLKTYAIQAGRELRVIVGADKIDDTETENLSTEIAKRIQDEMTYPGQVKITVIRETRAVSFAK